MTASEQLTNARLDRLKPKAQRYEIRDKTGLIVRIEPTGTITFYTAYRLHKQRRLLKHGEYGQMSLLEARNAHAGALAQVAAARRGEEKAKDPAAERDIRRAQAALGDTVRAFADVYIELYAKQKKRSWKTDRRILDRDVLPYLGSFKLRDVTRANVQAVLDRIDRRGSRNQAWQTLKVVRKMLNYAVSRGALEANPAAVIEREVTYNAKQRALSDKELDGLFKALPELKMQLPLRDLMLFQLLTAVRPSEAREADWKEIDLETRRWIIPKERMKMEKEHLVPLTIPVVQVLERMKALGDRGYVFPGEKAKKPFNLQALGHALRRKANQEILKRHGVAPFQPHDIRRTAATIMRKLKFGLVVDRVLAHLPQSIADKHYDMHDYEKEKAEALQGLADHLAAIEARARGRMSRSYTSTAEERPLEFSACTALNEFALKGRT
jgi:integrase